ncbi:MAG: ABC transporter ATP-binding protein [Clostridiales bacterium]|nr:ABC transporter ATP-binding protein [Clostridiales bacterium]
MRNKKFIRLFSYFKPYMGLLFLSLFLAFLINLADLASPYITKVIIDDYISLKKPVVNIVLLGLLYLAAALSGGVFNYIQAYLLNFLGQRIILDIRMELFSHVQKMALSFFDKNSSGRILTRITNDVEVLNDFYSGVIVSLFKDILMLIGIIVVMLDMNVKLTLLSMSVIPIIIIVTFLYKNKARRNFMRIRRLIASINGFLAENIYGMRLVQIFNRQKEKYREFEKLNNEYNRASIFEMKLMALFKPASELINSLAICILIWYCIPGIFNSKIEIGVLYAFVTYAKKFFAPISDLADMYNTIVSAGVAAERVFELMDDTGDVEDMDKGTKISRIRGEIEFRHVWFSYDNKNWVLKDINFKVNKGETVAFVGATGSGKSTIINLIGRFYEIQKGEILLDGVNIKDIRLKDLRRAIAVVMQDVFIFSGDIKNNIRLDNKHITDEQVVNAAKYSNAYDFIKNLPGKFNELVMERGCTLSSGQRQLLSFARAIAFKPSILVLDEATANIDTETERYIQKSLYKISRNRTTIIIAHRLSTIKNADKIIVINKGRIKEMGKHEELLRLGGIYKNLYDMQAV